MSEEASREHRDGPAWFAPHAGGFPGRRSSRDVTCRNAVAAMTDDRDGALSALERDDLHRHLRTCADCAEYATQLAATIAVVGYNGGDELSPAVRRALGRLYRRFYPQIRP